MKKGMTVVYEVDGALYVNLTNRCPNRCSFCIRNNGDGAYGSDSLWLEREPSVEEIIKAVMSYDLNSYRELVFCGYGEPTCRLDACRQVALTVKDKYAGYPIRINTNGLSTLINGADSLPLYRDAFDTVSVSLNTSTSEKYVEMCHPVYDLEAFGAIIQFAKDVKNYVHNVVFTVVREMLTDGELSECERIAAEVGVPLRVRTYIAADE